MEKIKFIIQKNKLILVDKSHPDYQKLKAIEDIEKIFHNLITKSGNPFITQEEYKTYYGEITIMANALRVLTPEVDLEYLK